MARQALFAGLVADDNGEPVDVAYIGGESFYVIDDHAGHVHTLTAQEDLRILFDDEMKLLLSHAGFEDVTVYWDYETEPVSGSCAERVTIISGRRAA